jgi:hypothetical protein
VGIVLFAFAVGTFSALHGANWDIDSVGYHLPEALRFFQSHRLTGIQFTSVDPAPAYYPANSELLHAVGMVLWGRDVLTPWINLGFAVLALLAGWCLGEALGSSQATLLAVATLAVAPSIAQGGNALNDGVGLALLVAAVALGLSPRGDPVRWIGALAAGLAVGTKLNLLIPVVCLGVAAVVLAGAGRRWRATGAWLAGLLAGGGFWFLRDLVHTGNPLPLLDLGPLPHVTLLPGESTNLVQGLDNGTLAVHQMTAALSAGLGRAWFLLLLAVVAGLVLAVWRGRAIHRGCAAVAILALISYAFTPLTGSQFAWTVRYAAPALALGLALVAAVPGRDRPGWGEWWAPLGLLALCAVTLRVPGGSHTGAVVVGALAALATALALRVVPPPQMRARGMAPALAAAGLVAVLIAGYPVARAYQRHRFSASPGGGPTATALLELARFGRTVSHARIAVVGIELQYQLAGPTLSNYVQYLGRPGPGGNWADIASCARWRHALAAGGYDYVVTAPTYFPTLAASLPASAPVPAADWTSGDPGAHMVLRPYPTVSVFALRSSVSARGCA